VPPFENTDLTLLANAMIGKMEQTPPAFSAIKVEGTPSYKLAARARHTGTQMKELPPRWIEVRKLRLRALDARHIDLTITTSKGAYIRTIGEKIAKRLKTCGHLVALRRTAVGDLKIDEAVKLKDLTAGNKGWVEIERLLPDAPRLAISHREQDMLAQGRGIPILEDKLEIKAGVELADCATILALSPEGELIALGEHRPPDGGEEAQPGLLGLLQPKRVLVHS